MNGKIRLIAYDIDGTLVPEYGDHVPEENRRAIAWAKGTGCIVCPASGRSHVNLRRLLGDLVSDTYCISMNGGQIHAPQAEAVHQRTMEDTLAKEIMRFLHDETDGNCIVFCRDSDYLFTSDPDTIAKVSSITEDPMKILTSPDEIREPIIKVSCYHPDAAAIYPRVAERFGGRINVAIAGKEWVDLTVADKGSGVLDLCAILGIRPEEAAAIGDNFNDLPMLEAVGHPVVMNSANPALLERFPIHCGSVAEAIERLLADC